MAKGFVDSIRFNKDDITINLTVIGYQDKEENTFVFYAPAFDLYAYGDDKEEAFQAFDETVYLYFNYVIEEKTFEKDLRRLGWKRHRRFKKRFQPPSYDPREIMSVKGVDSFNVRNKQLALQA